MNLDIASNTLEATPIDSAHHLNKFNATVADSLKSYYHTTGNYSEALELDEIGEKIKAFTGAAAATGQGLIDVTSKQLGMVVETQGGFLDFADFRESETSDPKFNNIKANGGFIAGTDGTEITNEISSFDTVTLNLARNIAEVNGYQSVLARSTSKETLIATVSRFLQLQKILRLERQAGIELTTNASIVEYGALASGAANAPIHTAMKDIAGQSGQWSDDTQRQVFVMSRKALAALNFEKTTFGSFIQDSVRTSFTPVAGNPQTGLVGTFDGYDVYVSSGILSTYTVAANRVSAQTGGTSTVIGFGLPYQLKIATSVASQDEVSTFNSMNSRADFRAGTMTFGLAFESAVKVLSPYTWRYIVI